MASSKKKASGKTSKKVPKSLRTGGLPRSVGDVWTAGVGALAQARATGEESFEALVALGSAVVDTGSKAARGALGQVEAAAGRLAGSARGLADGAADGVQHGAEGVVEEVLARLGVPTRDEVVSLREQIDGLQSRLAALTDAGGRRAGDGASTNAARAKLAARAELGDASPGDAGPGDADGPETERAVYHVAPHERGWSVQRQGTGRAASVRATKKEALHEARQTARQHAPSRLVVYKADGAVGQETDYDT